ncbi:MAG: 1-acyl-sn-glycerol-3-phosphate acyltransferase, partial [Ferruginibacter sp.]
MFYQLLKIPAKIAFLLYCRSVKINNKIFLSEKGPLLIACNHPNSFLDAVIIATLFKRPVYSLTRGDVYSNPFFSSILTSLKMLPVYRTSEGTENLSRNYTTFEHCKNIFKENGVVLIFSEGLCVNEWHLRPLKKGTARLALSSWEEGIDLKILPAGINYLA